MQKAPDAVDFEDIDEVADDEPPTAPAAPQLDSAIVFPFQFVNIFCILILFMQASKYYTKALESINIANTTTTTAPSSRLDEENYDDDGETHSTPSTTSVVPRSVPKV